VLDAARVFVIEIGQAPKALPEQQLTSKDQVLRADIACMHDLPAPRPDPADFNLQARVDPDLAALNGATLRALDAPDQALVRIRQFADRELPSPRGIAGQVGRTTCKQML
jgi:hypothetical protein